MLKNILFLFFLNFVFSQVHWMTFESEHKNTFLTINGKETIKLPKAHKLPTGKHMFLVKSDSMMIEFTYEITKKAHFRFNSDKSSYIRVSPIKSDYVFGKTLMNYDIQFGKDDIDTVKFSYDRGKKYVKFNSADSTYTISSPGYISKTDTIHNNSPYLVHEIETLSLVESDSYKLSLIEKQELKLLSLKNKISYGLAATTGLFAYLYYSSYEKSNDAYDQYLNNREITTIRKSYDNYKSELDKANMYGTVTIISSAFLIYNIFFEKYSDLSIYKSDIDNKKISLKPIVKENGSFISLSWEF